MNHPVVIAIVAVSAIFVLLYLAYEFGRDARMRTDLNKVTELVMLKMAEAIDRWNRR